ncbi:hypothetical protein BDZ45DRAFT_804718 [Acephala macrosclerotiorum]|nr:hypothetical protein BDZ45DRAFT_804718 [Acephala macrosclerotiorum]
MVEEYTDIAILRFAGSLSSLLEEDFGSRAVVEELLERYPPPVAFHVYRESTLETYSIATASSSMPLKPLLVEEAKCRPVGYTSKYLGPLNGLKYILVLFSDNDEGNGGESGGDNSEYNGPMMFSDGASHMSTHLEDELEYQSKGKKATQALFTKTVPAKGLVGLIGALENVSQTLSIWRTMAWVIQPATDHRYSVLAVPANLLPQFCHEVRINHPNRRGDLSLLLLGEHGGIHKQLGSALVEGHVKIADFVEAVCIEV